MKRRDASIAAMLAMLGALAYTQRAAIGCAMIDAGSRMLPEVEEPDDLEAHFAAAVADYCARRSVTSLNDMYRP